jgi:phosphinothricin acetyltransferase
MSEPTTRDAAPADAAAITEILNHYITHSTATFITEPETPEERIRWVHGRSAAHPAVVAELAESVVAWGALGPFRQRAAYHHTVEISVYVHHDFHRRGLGRAILNELLRRARAAKHHVVVGGCCSESVASICLLEGFGFTRVGYFPEVGRKFDRWLDVVFLQLKL